MDILLLSSNCYPCFSHIFIYAALGLVVLFCFFYSAIMRVSFFVVVIVHSGLGTIVICDKSIDFDRSVE